MVATFERPPWANRGVVLALPHSPLEAMATIQLRQRGWTVWQASGADHARQLAARHFPAVVVLAADAQDETGWLTCAKLKLAQPRLRVVLVGDAKASSEFADYVRAEALVPDEITAGDLIGEIEGATVAVV